MSKTTLAEQKKELRKKILAQRSLLSEEEQREASLRICEKIEKEKWFIEAEKVCLYMPFRQEISLLPLEEAIRKQGKTLWLPRVKGKDMEFYEYRRDTLLEEGSFGILEPPEEKALLPDEKTLIFLPGAVFTREGARIGYGGGFYDRYLKTAPCCKTIGAAYSFQVLKQIPVEEHDVRLDKVLMG